MEYPAGEKSVRRTPSVYSAAAAWFSAPIYSMSVGDALSASMISQISNIDVGTIQTNLDVATSFGNSPSNEDHVSMPMLYRL
jgi:hypothetical protein